MGNYNGMKLLYIFKTGKINRVVSKETDKGGEFVESTHTKY